MNKEKVNSEQHYALDSQNRLVNIRDIEEGKELYFCPYCKGEMIPKRGKIRDWHFAHKCLTENCSYESYLHSLAKLRLCEWFNNTTNAIICLESKHICSLFDECFWRKNAKDFECSNMTHKPWNLKKYYTNCEIEKQYGNYRADLFLAYKGEKDEPIFIEICVTHPCSEDKVKSGIRIIEFKIESEKDIDDIISEVEWSTILFFTMLFSAGIINALADALRDRSFPLVVDPVSVSQSGSRLLREDAVEALKERMIPGCDLLTPNRPEAEMLTGMTISCADDAAAAGEALIRMGAKAVLIKGGHMESSIVVTDCLCQAGQAPKFLPQPKVETNNNHGTGCTLSAAIATGLGHGLPLQVAVTRAQEFLNLALRKSYAPGKGCGPVNHAARR